MDFDNPRSATFVLRFAISKLAISVQASYAVAYVLRASGAFPQFLGEAARWGHRALPGGGRGATRPTLAVLLKPFYRSEVLTG